MYNLGVQVSRCFKAIGSDHSVCTILSGYDGPDYTYQRFQHSNINIEFSQL